MASPPNAAGTQPAPGNVPYFFGNENFQRNNKELLAKMKSVTAAKTRSEMAAEAARHAMVQQPAQGTTAMTPAGEFQNQHASRDIVQPQMNTSLQTGAAALLGLQQATGTGTAGSNQAALTQQAANLVVLQSLLAAGQVTTPPPSANTGLGQLLEVFQQGTQQQQQQQPQHPQMFDVQQQWQQFAAAAALQATLSQLQAPANDSTQNFAIGTNQAQPTTNPTPNLVPALGNTAQGTQQPALQANAQANQTTPQAPQQLLMQQLQTLIAPPSQQPQSPSIVLSPSDQQKLQDVIEMLLRYYQ